MNRSINIFLDVFCCQFEQQFRNSYYDLIGASISSTGQIIPNLSILRRLKEIDPKAKIAIGGPLMPYLESSKALDDELFAFIDHLVIGDGKIAIIRLLANEALPSKFNTNTLSIRPDEQTLLDTIVPTFDYHPHHLYLSNTFVIPYLIRRRCYWNKCAFCSLSRGPSHIQPKKVTQAVNDIVSLMSKHKTSYVMFNDDCLPVETFKALTAEIHKRSFAFWFIPPYSLCCNMKLSQSF